MGKLKSVSRSSQKQNNEEKINKEEKLAILLPLIPNDKRELGQNRHYNGYLSVEMKRSKSSQPIVQRPSQTLLRQRSFIGGGEKHKQFGKQKFDLNEIKPEKVLAEAEESYERAEYEKALMKFSKGAFIKPKNEAFEIGVRKSRIAILNDIKNSGDSVKVLKDQFGTYGQQNLEQDFSLFISDPKSTPMQKLQSKISSRSDNADVSVFKSDIAKSIFTNFKQKSSEQLYNLKIHDGKKYKTVSATTQDLKEYMKDKDYFKMKEQNANEWKKLRSEMNKKIAEKEAIERYEKEAKLLEERSNIRHYCDEQVTLIGRYYQNGKIADVIRFSENFIKYLNKKPDKLLPRKWVYLATAFNYLGRAFIEQENFEKAKMYGEKLYKIAISSTNTELISQSYILSGKIYVKFGKFEEAAFIWGKLIPLTENYEKKAWLFHEIGRCYFEMGKYDTSYKYGADSAYWAQKCSSFKWICSANVLQGQSEMKRNNYSNALEKFMEAKKNAEAINDEHIIKYIDSIEEILNVAMGKTKDNNVISSINNKNENHIQKDNDNNAINDS